MHAQPAPKRDISMDLARILAAVFVVWIHIVLIQWFTLDLTTVSWKFLNFYSAVARFSVPMFFMISGRLFLNKQSLPSAKLIFTKYILRLAVIYLLWGLFYAMDTIGVREVLALNIRGIWKSFLHSPKYHLWYLPSMTGVYLLMPLLWSIAKYKDGCCLGYACGMFLLCSIRCTVDALPTGLMTPNFMSYLTYELCGYSGYFLLGYYLSKNPLHIKSRWLLLAFLLVSLFSAGAGSYLSLRQGEAGGFFFDWLGIPACLQAVFLFCVFIRQKIQLSERTVRHIETASKCTLFCYLFHPFVIEHLNSIYEWLAEFATPIAAVPFMTVLVVMICYLPARLLIRIPLINKWLL